MAEINEETIEMLSSLSSISCRPEDRAALRKDLQGVVNYMGQLGELDTEGVEACYTVFEGGISLSEDIPCEPMAREKLLANCPHTAGMVRVPSVIKKN